MTWNEIEKANQRSGRTSRMLVEAVNAHKFGRAVYVVAASHRHAHEIRRMLTSMVGQDEARRIKVETADGVGFDWETMRVEMAHPNCQFFVDHYAIERRWYEMLLALHAWDVEARVP